MRLHLALGLGFLLGTQAVLGCAVGPSPSSPVQSPVTPKPNSTQVVGQGGNTDLATTIANAGNNGVVEVPASYSETINTLITITQSDLTITCDGDDVFTLGTSIGAPNFPGTATGMITVASGAGLTMSGCTLASTNNSNPTGIVGSLLVAQSGATNINLLNNKFINCYYYCMLLIDVPEGYIRGNSFTGLRSDGINIIGNSGNFLITENKCDTTGIAASPGHKCIDGHSGFGLITGTTSTSSTTITHVTNIADLAVGSTLTSSGLPAGTTVTAINTGADTITVSNNPTVSQSGLIMTLPNIRNLSNLTLTNNQMVTGTGFCIEIGDFGGAAPTNVVVTGNSCVAANLATAAPIASFTASTTAGSTSVIVSSTSGIANNQNMTGYGLSNGSIVTAINTGASTVTLSQPALLTQTSVAMVTSAPSGGYSFQNVQGLSMDNNSYANSTGHAASPGAIEIVGDTSSAPFFAGVGPTAINGGTLVGGGISINTVQNVTLSNIYVQPNYPQFPGYYGAVNIGGANNVNISGLTLDTRGVGPNKHSAVYDLCNSSKTSCSNLTVEGVVALDDGGATDAAYHLGFSSGTDMSNLSIHGGLIKGYTGPSASAYYINTNAALTNIHIEGVDDTGNTATFNSTGQVPGPNYPTLIYEP